jgi:hypothetical protein
MGFVGLKYPIPLLASPLKYPQGIKGRKLTVEKIGATQDRKRGSNHGS